MVRSACWFESEYVREDGETVSAFRVRVLCNARLKRCRRPRSLLREWYKLHVQRPREDVGCGVEFRFRYELYSYAIRPRTPQGNRVCEATLVGHEMVSPAPTQSCLPPSRAGTSNPKRVAFHSLNTFVKVWSGMSVAADFERRGLSYFRFGSDPKRPSFHDRTRTFLYTHLSGIGTLSYDRLPGVSEPVSQPLLISDVFGFQAYYIISPEAMQ